MADPVIISLRGAAAGYLPEGGSFQVFTVVWKFFIKLREKILLKRLLIYIAYSGVERRVIPRRSASSSHICPLSLETPSGSNTKQIEAGVYDEAR